MSVIVDRQDTTHAGSRTMRVRESARWLAVAVATVMSTLALDAIATMAGILFAASTLLEGAPEAELWGVLIATYALWTAGLRVNVIANWGLLERTGLSTNLLSKAMFELARRRTLGPSASRLASAVGYIGTEIAKEVPYVAGAFGAAMVSDVVGSTDAVAFLAGTNVGAAAYEFGLARLSRIAIGRRG